MVIKETKYLSFRVLETADGKIYEIFNKKHNDLLATIEYYPQWRQYCLIIGKDTVWNKTCLQDVIQFLKEIK